MNALDCTDIKALLSALIDDRLDAQTRHQVERHLAQCEACRAHVNEHERLETLLAMSGALALHEGAQLPHGFEDNVLARTVRAAAPAYSVFRSAVTWTGWFAAAASIALAALIWISDQRPAPSSNFALTQSKDEQTGTVTTPTDPASRRTQLASYATAMYLQSSVYDGAFTSPSELVSNRVTILGDLPRDPLAEFASEAKSTPASPVPARSAPAIGGLTREEADDIYHVSVLMHLLADADVASFADVERVRTVALADDLIDRLSVARQHVDAADRPVLLAAEAVLVRVVEGPLDQEDVRHLSETVARLNLPSEIGAITARWDQTHSM